APHGVGNGDHTKHDLQEKPDSGALATQGLGRYVVGKHGPQSDPGVSSQGNHGQQAEHANPEVAEQLSPAGIVQLRIEQNDACYKEGIKSQDNGGNPLNQPVVDAAA